MGKSGIIARNISQMFVSVGVRAVYINPVDALHGDVGVMTSDDVLVMFSKSGQTAELINLVPVGLCFVSFHACVHVVCARAYCCAWLIDTNTLAGGSKQESVSGDRCMQQQGPAVGARRRDDRAATRERALSV